MLPKIGKIYLCHNAYHTNIKQNDGRITGIKYPVLITGIIPFNEISEEILEVWKCKIKSSVIFSKKTDYFIISDSFEDMSVCTQIFVRSVNQRWFGFNLENDWIFNNGQLIIDEFL